MSGGGGSKEVPETAQEKELARIGLEQWNDYETRLKPYEDKWIESLTVTEGERENMAGTLNATVGKEFDRGLTQTQEQQRQMGASPNSGRFIAGTAGLTDKRAQKTGKAMAEGNQRLEDSYLSGLTKAVSMGRGEANTAMAMKGDLANQAARNAMNETFMKQQESDSTTSAISTAAGMGVAGYLNKDKK